MKLRNKKTEEIVDVYNIYISKRVEDDSLTSHENVIRSFGSIAELNEEWEDYIPDKSLIEDEEIREIIRTWAKANGATELTYYKPENCLEDIFMNEIHFNQLLGLEDTKTYTTEELCGEEEE